MKLKWKPVYYPSSRYMYMGSFLFLFAHVVVSQMHQLIYMNPNRSIFSLDRQNSPHMALVWTFYIILVPQLGRKKSGSNSGFPLFPLSFPVSLSFSHDFQEYCPDIVRLFSKISGSKNTLGKYLKTTLLKQIIVAIFTKKHHIYNVPLFFPNNIN